MLTSWQCSVILLVAILALERFWSGERLPPGLSSYSVSSGDSFNHWDRLSSKHIRSQTHRPDTTVVILNWSRRLNVIRIVSLLCTDPVISGDVVLSIWNNSPDKLFHNDFPQCSSRALTIFNSPSNVYFQARFLACRNATTTYCFIQDDDYLILPEIIRALRFRLSQDPNVSAVHLLPPVEVLSSWLKRVQTNNTIDTGFAWLGHGTMVRRSLVVEFLELLQALGIEEDGLKMADNYFAILRNQAPEVWYDQSIPLTGGQPFTVGAEGDERNARYIREAAALLDEILSSCTQPPCHNHSDRSSLGLPYVIQSREKGRQYIARAACRGAPCYLETSIPILPDIDVQAPLAQDLLLLEKVNKAMINADALEHHLRFPLSQAVDMDVSTSFCSPSNSLAGEFIRLHMPLYSTLTRWNKLQLVLLVPAATEVILQHCILLYTDKQDLVTAEQAFQCVDTSASGLRECSIGINTFAEGQNIPSSYELRLSQSVSNPWCIHEIWLRGLPTGTKLNAVFGT